MSSGPLGKRLRSFAVYCVLLALAVSRPAVEAADEPANAHPQNRANAPPALIVTGNVIDSETKEPIKSFRVVPGVRFSPRRMNWDRGGTFTATGGRYRLVETHDSFAHLVRIEADGYVPAESRDIKSGEGNVTIDFELTKGKEIDAVVLTPDGRPAAGAHVALGVPGSQITVINGEFDVATTSAARGVTDERGHLHFPPQEKPFYLVITHPSGYAEYKPTPVSHRRIINLDPWSRVEGTFRIGAKPRAKVRLVINRGDTTVFGNGVPSIFTMNQATTGAQGRFVFERVPAGGGWVGQRNALTGWNGAMEASSSCWVRAKFPLGKTVHIDLGGTGRPVVGKLRAPADFRKAVLWGFATIRVRPQPGEAADGSFYFTATVGPDGAFRIDDVPAGQYSLNVQFFQFSAGRLINHRFSVPGTKTDTSAEPIDLGVLTLKKD